MNDLEYQIRVVCVRFLSNDKILTLSKIDRFPDMVDESYMGKVQALSGHTLHIVYLKKL